MQVLLTQRNPEYRIAVLCGYMPFFDEIMPVGYQTEKERWGRSVSELFSGLGEVFYAGLVTDYDTGVRIGRQLAEFDPDVILLAPTMASPPGFTWAAIERLERVPVVLWNAHELDTLPPAYDMPDLCRHSANVGTLMIANVMARHGRKPAVTTGRYADEDVRRDVYRLVRAAAVAGRLTKARFGVVGQPLDGYLNITADPEDLRRHIGTSLVPISVEEFTDAFRAVRGEQVQALGTELRRLYQVQVADPGEFQGSVRLTLALKEIVDRHGLSGGTFNCRLEYSVGNPAIGLIGCLSNTVLTTAGYPFTCTGDIVTAVAMYLGKHLGGNTFYCECDAVDYDRDLMLCANTGEGDFCLAAGCSQCSIISSGAASGRKARGCSVLHPVREGPATLIGFSPNAFSRGGYALQVAPGTILGGPDLAIRVPVAWFRFQNGPTVEAFNRWCRAGATHHAGLSSGDLTEDLVTIGELLGIGVNVI